MPQIEATVEKGRIKVKSPFAAAPLAKSIAGGLWKPEDGKRWTYPISATVAESIFRRYTTAGFEIACDRAFVELCARAADQIIARKAKTALDLPDIPGTVEAWTHQRQAFHFAQPQDGALLAVGMGGGKTKISISIMDGRDARNVLIVCPKNVVAVWPKEFAKHSGEKWHVWANSVHGKRRNPDGTLKLKKNPSIKERVASIEQFLMTRPTEARAAVVVNYEAAWQGELGEFLLSRDWDVVALDESHRIKAPGGAASKFCGQLRDRAGYRLCMTGTPQPHSPLDIYAQARFIDPGVFGTNFAKFRNRYAIMGGYENREIVGWQNEDELAQKIAQFSYIIDQDTLDKYLALIDPVDVTKTCVLDPKSQKVYDDLWNGLLAEAGDGTQIADNPLTKLLRVQQVTSGHLPVDTEDGSKVEVIGNEKQKLLADTLEDIEPSEPVVVFCRFRHDLDAIREVAEAAGRRYGELSGRDRSGIYGTEDVERGSTMREDVDVLAVQIQAGGVGIDLTRARYAIFYSIGFNLGDYLQARKRVHRPGQAHRVVYTHLIAANTIDEYVYAALEARQDLVEAVMRAAKESS